MLGSPWRLTVRTFGIQYLTICIHKCSILWNSAVLLGRCGFLVLSSLNPLGPYTSSLTLSILVLHHDSNRIDYSVKLGSETTK